MKIGLPLMKIEVKPVAKNAFLLLGVTAATSATNVTTYGFGIAAPIISNEEMDDMKIVRFFEEFGLLIKGVSGTIKNETKEQKSGFLSMLIITLGTSLLGYLLYFQ